MRIHQALAPRPSTPTNSKLARRHLEACDRCPHGRPDPDSIAVESTKRFESAACLPSDSEKICDGEEALTPPNAVTMKETRRRKYHRKKKSMPPRTHRTRPDPFESVKDDLNQWVLNAPESTSKWLLQELQRLHPGQYPDQKTSIRGSRSFSEIRFFRSACFRAGFSTYSRPGARRVRRS